ncbi:MAG: hypothetical protein MJ188_01410 [Treponema sp.]|nr:hypothetical protein [Treponema sp.]
MKRNIFLFAILFSLCVELFSYSGALSGEKNLQVVSTSWFDIIYPEGAERSAQILYEKADGVYQEIADLYGRPIPCRIPVVITPAVEEFNAYWTDYPYNHIVIYDAPLIEDLAVFSETLLQTFRHELTHAYTYNMKSPLWKSIGALFGDPIYLPYFSITSGFSESATVTSESSFGEGRLNDEYAKQMVRQAKIENQFPKFKDVQGGSDVYPGGSFYYFNGAFFDYMQKTYGMEKYAELWYRCVNFKNVTFAGAFKKIYGKLPKDAWMEFYEAYEVPAIPENPVKAGLVEDFFEDLYKSTENNNDKNSDSYVGEEKRDYSSWNNKGARYASLSVSEQGMAYVDSSCRTVFFLKNGTVTPEKLFVLNYISTARLSADGKYLAVTYYTEDSATTKIKSAVYNMQNGKWFYLDETGLNDVSLVQKAGDYYLVGTKYGNQVYTTVVQKMVLGADGAVLGLEKGASVDFYKNDSPWNYVDCGEGVFAFIKRSGLDYSLCAEDLDGNILWEVKAPEERMVIRGLSYNCEAGELMFSWAKPGSMPRWGAYFIEDDVFALGKEDLSGGVHEPVLLGKDITYVGQFYRQNRLLKGAFRKEDGELFEGKKVCFGENQNTEAFKESFADAPSLAELPSRDYNQFDFYKRGILLPVTTLSSKSFNPLYDGEGNRTTGDYGFAYGLSYITANPWSSDTLQVEAGFSFQTNSVAIGVTYGSGTDTSLFKYAVKGFSEFDKYLFKQGELELDLSSVIPFGKYSDLTCFASGFGHYGRSNLSIVAADEKMMNADSIGGLFGPAFNPDRSNYVYTTDSLGITVSNIHKYGAGRYEKIGLSVGTNLAYVYNSKVSKGYEEYANSFDLILNSALYIPKLVPVNCVSGMTYNLPTKILVETFGGLYPLGNFAGRYALIFGAANAIPQYDFQVNTETVLFAKELQKGSWIPAFFLYDVKLSLCSISGYMFSSELRDASWKVLKVASFMDEIKTGTALYSGVFSLKITLSSGLNIGSTANSSTKNEFFFYVPLLSFGKDTKQLEFKPAVGLEFAF